MSALLIPHGTESTREDLPGRIAGPEDFNAVGSSPTKPRQCGWHDTSLPRAGDYLPLHGSSGFDRAHALHFYWMHVCSHNLLLVASRQRR
jgi:hypothetical protein